MFNNDNTLSRFIDSDIVNKEYKKKITKIEIMHKDNLKTILPTFVSRLFGMRHCGVSVEYPDNYGVVRIDITDNENRADIESMIRQTFIDHCNEQCEDDISESVFYLFSYDIYRTDDTTFITICRKR